MPGACLCADSILGVTLDFLLQFRPERHHKILFPDFLLLRTGVEVRLPGRFYCNFEAVDAVLLACAQDLTLPVGVVEIQGKVEYGCLAYVEQHLAPPGEVFVVDALDESYSLNGAAPV